MAGYGRLRSQSVDNSFADIKLVDEAPGKGLDLMNRRQPWRLHYRYSTAIAHRRRADREKPRSSLPIAHLPHDWSVRFQKVVSPD
ncbi:hypothetical protein AVEN_141855-1 [Araneus ventricosus]|uniref:Uncharacterized protein n=1 Tax=Araneus ventricosus TaxID=182803 RepID=A0A4Y2L563_ARAVE|nr:hypothetical protein AVEN_141855-1 [Araneus ventricosus]